MWPDLVIDEGGTNQKVEVFARGVRPQNLPKPHHVTEGQLALEPN